MSRSNYLPSLSIWTEIPILTNFFEKFFEIFFFDSCVSKIIPSPICMKTAFCGGVFEKDSQHIYKTLPSKKHPLPIPIKIAVCPPCLEKCLPCIYKNPILQQLLSPNSHRKLKTAPSFENIPHIYEKNRGFYTLF
jgi:hypothetical protein